MRIAPLMLGLVWTLSLSACTSPKGTMEAAGKSAHPNATSFGWVLEDAGKNVDGKTLTHVSVYADTINDKGELERTNLFEVETMPGCEHAPNGDVRCAANGYADEFRLREDADTVTFGHRKIRSDGSDEAVPFDTLKTFTAEEFAGTRLAVGVARSTKEPK